MTPWDKFWEKLREAIGSVVPLERWVSAVSNLLKLLVLMAAFVFLTIVGIIVQAWGFTSTERFWLLVIFAGVWLAIIIVCVILALRSADAFYTPYERSLAKGMRFGTRKRPLTRQEVEALPSLTEVPGLPSPTGPTPLPLLPTGDPGQ